MLDVWGGGSALCVNVYRVGRPLFVQELPKDLQGIVFEVRALSLVIPGMFACVLYGNCSLQDFEPVGRLFCGRGQTTLRSLRDHLRMRIQGS
jgi:hypothetical protein